MSTSTVPVKTAAEAALARADQPPDEPSDEELVIRARFVSSIRSGPKAEISGVYYCGQFMSLEAALAAEKVDFLARAREALRKRREAEEQARAAALERQRQKAVFEADAAEARAQARLAEALTIYQHTLGELAEVNAQIDATIVAGARGIVILGLATEVQRLSLEEKHRLIDWTSAHLAGRVPLAVTVSGDTVEAQVALAEHAAARGASWLILQPPAQRGLPESFYFDFFASVIERTTVPAGIQNAPEYLGVGLSAQSIVALAEQCPRFRLLKGEGPAVTIRATIDNLRALGQPLPVFNGRGGQELIDNLRAGCAGLIIAPDTFDWQAASYDAFGHAHEARAQTLYAQVLPAIVFVMQSLDTLTCYGKRIAAWRMGFDVRHDRGIAPTPFGLECARRFAETLGRFGEVRDIER